MQSKKVIGMVGVLSNPAKKITSHNGGWTMVIKSIAEKDFDCEVKIMTDKDDWDQCEMLIVNEGVNYKMGQYNLFGGVTRQILDKLEKLNSFKGKVVNYGEFIDYSEFCEKRKIDFNFTQGIHYKFTFDRNKLVYGDSHAISVYKPSFGIDRNDGKTLFGMLSEGLDNNIRTGLDELIFYAGNIDVRHHILRNYKGNNMEDYLVKTYFEKLQDQLKDLNCKKITLVELLPIEDVTRKIPGTGMYMKTPFCGTWKERSNVVKIFNNLLKDLCKQEDYDLISWPDENSDEYGMLKFEVMEARQSVHLAPHSYYFADEFVYKKQLNLF